MKTYRRMEVSLQPFLISTLMELNGQLSGRDPLGGSWVAPIAGVDALAKGKNPLIAPYQNPGRPTRSQVTILTELSGLLHKERNIHVMLRANMTK
jgi:hypothetical protein